MANTLPCANKADIALKGARQKWFEYRAVIISAGKSSTSIRMHSRLQP
ncbi:hypothetical protein [Roseibium sediminis]|nr:hypothetical protein [Roseibium sediminis]